MPLEPRIPHPTKANAPTIEYGAMVSCDEMVDAQPGAEIERLDQPAFFCGRPPRSWKPSSTTTSTLPFLLVGVLLLRARRLFRYNGSRDAVR